LALGYNLILVADQVNL